MNQKEDKSNFGYVLRIARKEWLEQVFDLTRYYTGLTRSWRSGTPILFVYHTEHGDAFMGYGIIKEMLELNALSYEERRMCAKWKWKLAIDFDYVLRFSKPLLVKDTVLGKTKMRGKFLHGLRLDSLVVESIIGHGKSES